MTFEEVKKIRENPTMADVDNEELHKLIDIALEKQIPKSLQKQGVKQYARLVALWQAQALIVDIADRLQIGVRKNELWFKFKTERKCWC